MCQEVCKYIKVSTKSRFAPDSSCIVKKKIPSRLSSLIGNEVDINHASKQKIYLLPCLAFFTKLVKMRRPWLVVLFVWVVPTAGWPLVFHWLGWVVLLYQVVPRAGLCIETDYATACSICEDARASLKHLPNAEHLAKFSWSPKKGKPAFLPFDSLFCELFQHHLLLLLSFLPFLPFTAPRAFPHHLLLLFLFQRAGSVAQLFRKCQYNFAGSYVRNTQLCSVR